MSLAWPPLNGMEPEMFLCLKSSSLLSHITHHEVGFLKVSNPRIREVGHGCPIQHSVVPGPTDIEDAGRVNGAIGTIPWQGAEFSHRPNSNLRGRDDRASINPPNAPNVGERKSAPCDILGCQLVFPPMGWRVKFRVTLKGGALQGR